MLLPLYVQLQQTDLFRLARKKVRLHKTKIFSVSWGIERIDSLQTEDGVCQYVLIGLTFIVVASSKEAEEQEAEKKNLIFGTLFHSLILFVRCYTRSARIWHA